jgi:hypothetical protein
MAGAHGPRVARAAGHDESLHEAPTRRLGEALVETTVDFEGRARFRLVDHARLCHLSIFLDIGVDNGGGIIV